MQKIKEYNLRFEDEVSILKEIGLERYEIDFLLEEKAKQEINKKWTN